MAKTVPMASIQKTLRIFHFIKRYVAANGEAPTFAEIGRRFDFRSSASVFDHLKKMEARGWIKRTPYSSRGIQILDEGRKIAA